jgi:hypothetical protein
MCYRIRFLKFVREQSIESVDHFPEPVQTVNAVLLFRSRGSIAYPELHVTSTAVEQFAFVVFKTAFEMFSAGQTTIAKHTKSFLTVLPHYRYFIHCDFIVLAFSQENSEENGLCQKPFSCIHSGTESNKAYTKYTLTTPF